MKTQLYALPDWRSILEELGWSDAPTAEEIEKTVLQELTRGKVSFAPQNPATPIEKGCRVTLKTKSVLPKFNKEKISVTVGTGLYDRGLEARLCGMIEGESAEAMVKGEKVTFTVLKVEKKSFPALTDELVQDLHLDGITTLAEYRRYMDRKIKTAYAAELARKLATRLIGVAQMDLPAEEDVRRVIDLEYEPLRTRFSLDGMSPEEWKEAFRPELRDFYAQIYPDVAYLFGTTGKESYYESRQEAAAGTVRICLVLREILKEDADPTEDPKAEQKLMQTIIDRLLYMIYGG